MRLVGLLKPVRYTRLCRRGPCTIASRPADTASRVRRVSPASSRRRNPRTGVIRASGALFYRVSSHIVFVRLNNDCIITSEFRFDGRVYLLDRQAGRARVPSYDGGGGACIAQRRRGGVMGGVKVEACGGDKKKVALRVPRDSRMPNRRRLHGRRRCGGVDDDDTWPPPPRVATVSFTRTAADVGRSPRRRQTRTRPRRHSNPRRRPVGRSAAAAVS